VQDLDAGDLKIAVQAGADHGPIQLHWTGKSNDRQPARVLSPYLRNVLEHAAAAGRSVEMHFERIVHFNSSTISALIEFILDAKGKGVGLDIVYDGNLKWQRLSFDTLKKVTAKDSAIQLRSV
jgi:hypothetical protein